MDLVIKEILLKLIIERISLGRKTYTDLFTKDRITGWCENENHFDSIIKKLADPTYEISYLDAYKTTKFKFKKKVFIYLNIYGQEDCWDDEEFDVCLIHNRVVYIALFQNGGIKFYEGALPKEYKLFFGKRAYYFYPKSGRFLIRCGLDNYLRDLYDNNKSKHSETWCSGPHCKIFLKRLKDGKVEINKNVLFRYIQSHAALAANEYHRNPNYNQDHFSYKAEEEMIKELKNMNLLDEYLKFANEVRLDREGEKS